jgi:hypothetical protein
MKTQEYANFEYDYWLKIIDAIERFTAKKNFFYDRFDFVSALERSLFFDVMDQIQYPTSIKAYIGKKIQKVSVKNQVHKEILSLAYNDIIFDIENKSSSSVFAKLKFLAKKIISSNLKLYNFYLYFRYRGFSRVQFHQSKYVFVSIHHKFIRYLAPIYKKLDDAIFLLCADVQKSVELCKANGYKYQILSRKVELSSLPVSELFWLVLQYEQIKATLMQIKPKVIVVAEGNAPTDELSNIAGKKINAKTICVQQGWAPIVHNGFRKMHYDRFLAWGDEFVRILMPYNPDQVFQVAGAHMIDPVVDKESEKAIAFFLQAVTPLITQNIYNDFVEFAGWVALMWPGERIIIREHPSHPIGSDIKSKLSEHKNIIFMNPDRFLLDDVLRDTKIAVAIYSTVLLEAIAYKAIPFIFNLTAMPRYSPDIARNGLGVEVKNINEARIEIAKLIESDKIRECFAAQISKFRSQYFTATGEASLAEIVGIIRECK